MKTRFRLTAKRPGVTWRDVLVLVLALGVLTFLITHKPVRSHPRDLPAWLPDQMDVPLQVHGLWWTEYAQLVSVPDTLFLVCADSEGTQRVVTFARTQDLLSDPDYQEDRCWRLWNESSGYRLSQLQFVGWFYTH